VRHISSMSTDMLAEDEEAEKAALVHFRKPSTLIVQHVLAGKIPDGRVALDVKRARGAA